MGHVEWYGRNRHPLIEEGIGPFDEHKEQELVGPPSPLKHPDDRAIVKLLREELPRDQRGASMVIIDGFLYLFPSFFLSWCAIVMGAEELDLMPETVVAFLTKKNVCQLEEKFSFMIDILLEVPGEDECITDGMAMRVTLHKESWMRGSRYAYSQHW